MKLARISVFALAAAFASAALAHADDQKPIRHLVYNFGVSIATTSTQHVSGIGTNPGAGGPVDGGAASGSVDSHASNSDTGTIIADVMALQPDSGLVVRISEQGRGTRSSDPTMCVTYGTGSVLCDMTKGGPNEEEMSLLRVLGRDFINPALLDAKNHWRTTAAGANGTETNDYTMDSHNGDFASISFQRVLDVSGAQPFNASTQGHITYNQKLTVPTAMTEDTITRRNISAERYDTIDQKFTFTLSSDSLAQTGH